MHARRLYEGKPMEGKLMEGKPMELDIFSRIDDRSGHV